MITLRRLFRGRLACPSAVFSSILFTATLATASGACVTATRRRRMAVHAMTSQTGLPSWPPLTRRLGLTRQFRYRSLQWRADRLRQLRLPGALQPHGPNRCLQRHSLCRSLDHQLFGHGVWGFSAWWSTSPRNLLVYVTPAGGTELTVGLNYAFRISATTLNYWGVYVSSTSGGAGFDTVVNFSTGGTITTCDYVAPAAVRSALRAPLRSIRPPAIVCDHAQFWIQRVQRRWTAYRTRASLPPTFNNVQTNHTISAAFQQQSSGEGPFSGTPAAIPGTVQAENYDTGGRGCLQCRLDQWDRQWLSFRRR